MSKFNRALFIILVAVIIGLTAAIVYLSATPNAGDRFPEFYVLNSEGKASGYPREIMAGQPSTVTLGVINREGAPTAYRIQVAANGAIINSIETGTVLNGQKWERKVDFTLDSAGDNQTVEFYLYRNNETTPRIKDALVLKTNVIKPK
jgi:uncharacterized membrane protein